MNRLLFEKTDDAVYLSHLDLMRVFQRAFKRADIMIWHSQGFSPRAYVSIALPLPVGSESVCEILDFEIQDGSVDLAKLPALLNRTMPAGIRVLEAYESAVKIKHLTRLRAQITLEYDRGVPEQAERTIMELFSGGPVLVKKRTKSGGEDFWAFHAKSVRAGAGADGSRLRAESKLQPAAAGQRDRALSAGAEAGLCAHQTAGNLRRTGKPVSLRRNSYAGKCINFECQPGSGCDDRLRRADLHDGRHGGRDLCEITGRRAGKE